MTDILEASMDAASDILDLEEAEELFALLEAVDTSRPIDFTRAAEGQLLSRIVDLVDAIAGRVKTKRFGTHRRQQLKANVEALVVNLYAAWKASPLIEVRIAKRKNWYSENAYWIPRDISYRYLIDKALKGLSSRGMVKTTQYGQWDKEKQTGKVERIRATPTLIDFIERERPIWPWEITSKDDTQIILRGPKQKGGRKPDLAFKETKQTRQMRANLKRINAMLTMSWVDLDLSDEEFADMAASRAQQGKPVDLSRRTVRRVFNNGTFEQGGRFYGAWWHNVGRSYRERIAINGKPTVEVDFSGMHARMLYQMEGLKIGSEPYDLGIFGDDKKDLKQKYRDLSKRAFNALINAGPKGIRRFPEFREAEVDLSWEAFLEKVREQHQAISHHFNTGIGLVLQRKDSEIAERVLLRFADKRATCLPVHDSFIVHHGYEGELRQIMEGEYQTVMGITDKVDTKPKRWEKTLGPDAEDGFEILPNDLDSILADEARYSGFNSRLRAWWDRGRVRAGVNNGTIDWRVNGRLGPGIITGL